VSVADIPYLHPGWWLAGLGIVALFLRGGARRVVTLIAPMLALAVLIVLPDGTHGSWALMGQAVPALRMDPLARLFGIAFAIAALAGVVFAWRQESRVEGSAALVYAGAAIAAALSADLVTLFVSWEAMALASTAILWSAGPAAFPAAQRYLAVHLLGGMLLMAGIVGYVGETGSITLAGMAPDNVSRALILAGFLVNAAAVPLASWLPDAYPESSWSGMVFLSAFTTKVALLALLRAFPGAEVLVVLGLLMALYGAAYALVESDMRRILAYAIVGQQGVMLVGVGIGTPLSINGATSHAVASIFYTGLVAMATGAVLYQTGRRDCGDLGGLWRPMPFTAAAACLGALAFAGVPLASGFVTKSLVSAAAAESGLDGVRWSLAAASAASLLAAGFKLPWRVFFHRTAGLRPAEAPVSQRVAMSILAAMTLAIGLVPGLLYRLLPLPVSYEPFTVATLLGTAATMGAGALAVMALLPLLRRSNSHLPDIDQLWRGPGPRIALAIERAVQSSMRAIAALRRAGIAALVRRFQPGTRGASLARNWTVRVMVLWVVVALAGILVLSYR